MRTSIAQNSSGIGFPLSFRYSSQVISFSSGIATFAISATLDTIDEALEPLLDLAGLLFSNSVIRSSSDFMYAPYALTYSRRRAGIANVLELKLAALLSLSLSLPSPILTPGETERERD